jgi:hypothetical protein
MKERMWGVASMAGLMALFFLQASCSSPGRGDDDADAEDGEAEDTATDDAGRDDGDAVGEDAAEEDVEEEEGNPHTQMLENLGLDTSPPEPTDPDGNPLPEGFNPFGRRHTVFNPIDEIYFAGFGYGERNQYLIDDAGASYDDLYSTVDDSWAGAAYKNVIGADVDGDGFEEVVIVYYVPADTTLYWKVINIEMGVYVEYDGIVADGISRVPALPEYMPGLAAGDLDGDGMDEVAVTFADLFVIDDMDADFKVSMRPYDHSREMYVAAGEIDGDGIDELIVTYHFNGYAYCDIFDGDLSAPLLLETQLLHAPGLAHTYEHNVHVQMGDIDGDHLDEMVFLGERRDYSAWNVTAMDDARAGFKWLDFFFWTDPQICNSQSLAVGDYDGDGIDDIFASNWVIRYDEDGTDGTNADILNQIFPQYPPFVGCPYETPRNVWMGDVDGDMKDELLYYRSGGFRVDGQDTLGANVNEFFYAGSYNGSQSKLAALNVDNDSPLLEYRGEHELLFGDPSILAVMAAPPYHADVGQNIDSCGTTFGKTTSTGIEASQSLGFSVGFSIGYEWEDIFGISKVSFKATTTQAWSWMSSSSMEISRSIAYTSGPDEDKVIFTAVPFDVYYYTIISSPDADDVGNIMSVNVPREMETLSVARTFYNDNNGEGPDVDETVLAHTIGEVASYPGPGERNTLLEDGGLTSTESPVGVGTGSITVTVDTTTGQGSGTSYDFDFTIESEVGVGGVTFGVSLGFQYGYEYWETNTESTFYEGTVGDIPASSFTPELAYTFGLFAYPFEHEGQKFTVVNYWVE